MDIMRFEHQIRFNYCYFCMFISDNQKVMWFVAIVRRKYVRQVNLSLSKEKT